MPHFAEAVSEIEHYVKISDELIFSTSPNPNGKIENDIN